jgi:hypothetical protein
MDQDFLDSGDVGKKIMRIEPNRVNDAMSVPAFPSTHVPFFLIAFFAGRQKVVSYGISTK